jgi:hypothetical protein
LNTYTRIPRAVLGQAADVAFANPPVFRFALAVGLPCAYALSRYGGVASVVLLVLALVFRALPRFAVNSGAVKG